MDPHSFMARAEAQRWLGIAEKLLMGHDLVGSKTFAIRARESDPRLEAADLILAIADTLLAAEKRVVGNNGTQQPDFYAILQLVRFVQDTEHIASQYRRLAVMLNPHQNRFPYADQAFQLVNDAWAVLSNPMRKSMYDADLDFPPQQQMNPIGFNLEQQHQQQQHHHQQQQQHNFFSINHMGSGHEQELPEPPHTFQTRVQQSHQQQQLQQHNFLSQSNPVRSLPVREQEQLFQVTSTLQHREHEQLFQTQVQPFQITSSPQQPSRPQPQPQPQPPQPQAQPQPPQSKPRIQSPTPHTPAAPSQPPFSWPQAPPLSQPQQQPPPSQPHPQPQPKPHLQTQLSPQQPQSQAQPSPQRPQSQAQPLLSQLQPQQPQPQQPQPQPPLQQQQQHLQPHQLLQQEQRQQEQQHRQPTLRQESLEQNTSHIKIPSPVNINNGVREEETETEADAEAEVDVETETAAEDVDESPTFWTVCPYCFYMYEYPRVYAECTLRCDHCKRAFQAVRVPSPPQIIEGQDAYFYCWGFFPVGVSMSHLEKNHGKSRNSNWTPFSPLFDASSNVQDHLNGRAAPKENFYVNKNSGPRIYIDDITDDVFIDVSEPSDDSDGDWVGTGKEKVKRTKRDLKLAFKCRSQVLGIMARDARNGSVKNQHNRIPVQEEGVRVPTVPVVDNSKKPLGSNPRMQSGRVAKELGKLDLNVEFNNNEGEEPVPRMTGVHRGSGQGEEDNIEGNSFFEGLDEFLSSLPILSVVNEEKAKAA